MTTTTRPRRSRFAAALLAAVALVLGMLGAASAAHAAGSDAPTPYTVTAEGLTLPEGVTFPAHGHVNWRTTWAQHGVHFDPNNNQPGGAYIGESFLAWNLEPGECIVWVQVSMYNEHFGEGGQAPVCAPAEEQPEPEQPPYVPPVLNCGEWQVPGWLNEHGDPTSCVSNHPCPGLEAPACIPTEEENPWNPEPTDPPTETTPTPGPSEPSEPSSPSTEPVGSAAPSAPAEPSTEQLPMLTPPAAVSAEHDRTELPATGAADVLIRNYAGWALGLAGLGIVLATIGAVQSRRRRVEVERLERIATGDERSTLFP